MIGTYKQWQEMAYRMRSERDAAEALCKELLAHLDYCGWGDSWEREVSEELRERAEAWLKAIDAG